MLDVGGLSLIGICAQVCIYFLFYIPSFILLLNEFI